MDIRTILYRATSDRPSVDRVIDSTKRLMARVDGDFAPGFAKSVSWSGSWAKNTEIAGSSDADLFISVTSTASATLRELYSDLYRWAVRHGLAPREQNVSIGVAWEGLKVDLVPGRRHDQWSDDHSLYVRRTGTWTKTNVAKHIALVKNSGRTNEIRLMKVWRRARRFHLPSFLLELIVLEALHGRPKDALEDNIRQVLTNIAVRLPTWRLVDPANSNNVVSDELTEYERRAIATAADRDRDAAYRDDWARVFS